MITGTPLTEDQLTLQALNKNLLEYKAQKDKAQKDRVMILLSERNLNSIIVGTIEYIQKLGDAGVKLPEGVPIAPQP